MGTWYSLRIGSWLFGAAATSAKSETLGDLDRVFAYGAGDGQTSYPAEKCLSKSRTSFRAIRQDCRSKRYPNEPISVSPLGEQALSFHLPLETETVDRAHPTDALTVPSGLPIREVLRLLKQERRGCAVVCRDERVVGIFTERDALRVVARQTDLRLPIEQAMTPSPHTIRNSATVGHAIREMSTGHYRRLPIVDEKGAPTGILKVSGILHYLVEHFPQFIYNLPPTPHHSVQQREGA